MELCSQSYSLILHRMYCQDNIMGYHFKTYNFEERQVIEELNLLATKLRTVINRQLVQIEIKYSAEETLEINANKR